MPRLSGLFFRRLIACLTIVSQILTPLYYAGLLNPLRVQARELNTNGSSINNEVKLPPLSIWDGEKILSNQNETATLKFSSSSYFQTQINIPTYQYADNIIDTQRLGEDGKGDIQWFEKSSMLGPQGNGEARIYYSADKGNRACTVVTIGGVSILNKNPIEIYARGWGAPTNWLGLDVYISDTSSGCGGNWTYVGRVAPGLTAQWYSIPNVTGTVRAIRIDASIGENQLNWDRNVYIDSVRLYGAFTPEVDADQTAGDKSCNPCGDAATVKDTHVQVDRPIDPLTGNYTYSTEDINLQGVGQPLVFKRVYSAHGHTWAERFTDNAFPLGVGWTHNYNMRLLFDSTRGGLFIDGSGSGYRFDFVAENANGERTFTFKKGFLVVHHKDN